MNRKLGAFSVTVAAWQVVLYAMWRSDVESDWYFYLDPRAGWAFFGMAMHVGTPPFAAQWVSAALLGVVGVGLWRSGFWVRAYLVVEAVLSAPTLAMIVLLGRERWGTELLAGVALFVVVSVAPFLYGMRVLRMSNREDR